MRTKLVQIGNSRGIRLPRSVIEQCGFGETVELEVESGHVLIRPVEHPRAGWDDAFRRMAELGEDELLDPDLPSSTTWDDEEWEW